MGTPRQIRQGSIRPTAVTAADCNVVTKPILTQFSTFFFVVSAAPLKKVKASFATTLSFISPEIFYM